MGYFSQSTALILLILTTLMWGSWFQFSKRLNGYPVSAFMLLLYSFSVVLVWVIIAILKPYFFEESIRQMFQDNTGICLGAVLCGMMQAAGTQVNMRVIKNVGMILATSITATTGILLGTAISVYFGGLRAGQSVGKIFLGAVVLLAATILSQYAALMRDRDTGAASDQQNYREEIRFRFKELLMLLASASLLTPAYSFAQSAFVKTDLRADGIPQLLCIGFLSIGGFLGTLMISGIQLTVRRQWHLVLSSRKIIAMSVVSAVCHYGGNVLYTFCAPILSHAVAWPIGTCHNFWHYVWGIGYGEFKGTTRKTKLMLGTGMAGFVLGVLILC